MLSRIISSRSINNIASSAALKRGFQTSTRLAAPVHVGSVQVPGDSRTRTVTVLPGKGFVFLLQYVSKTNPY